MLTIVCANAYWGRHPLLGADTRFRYVLEYRGLFNPHCKPPMLTPDWAIQKEQYALGFLPPNYPVPSLIVGQFNLPKYLRLWRKGLKNWLAITKERV